MRGEEVSPATGAGIDAEGNRLFFTLGPVVKMLNSDFTPFEHTLVMDGPVDSMAVEDGYLFIAYTAPVPGKTARPVGLVRAIDLRSNAQYDLRVRKWKAYGLYLAWCVHAYVVKCFCFSPSQVDDADFAHRLSIFAMDTAAVPGQPPVLFTGSMDGEC